AGRGKFHIHGGRGAVPISALVNGVDGDATLKATVTGLVALVEPERSGGCSQAAASRGCQRESIDRVELRCRSIVAKLDCGRGRPSLAAGIAGHGRGQAAKLVIPLQ